MEHNKIGKAIAYLRKRAGYTQKDLADRIGISDKAVSKWERGLGLPDIGYLRKLSILLDTDTDSLLAGDVVHHDEGWQGVLLLDQNPFGIGAGTIIFDKPLVYFLLGYFLLVGIRDVTIICTEKDKPYLARTLGDGREYGICLKLLAEGLREVEISAKNVMVVHGRCLLYGVDQTRFFQKAMIHKERVTMLALPKRAERGEAAVSVTQDQQLVSSDEDEPIRTQYDFSALPIIFLPAKQFSELTQADGVAAFVMRYSSENPVYVEALDRGFVAIEIDDWNNVHEAATFIKIVQDKCGMNVYCLEEVAWRRGFISLAQMKTLGLRRLGTPYGDYILSLCERMEKRQPTVACEQKK